MKKLGKKDLQLIFLLAEYAEEDFRIKHKRDTFNSLIEHEFPRLYRIFPHEDFTKTSNREIALMCDTLRREIQAEAGVK